VVQQRQFELLARVLGREHWLEDARFSDPDCRRANAKDMQAELSSVFGSRAAAVWEAELSAAGIPCGMVRSVGEAVSLPGLDDRALRVPVTIPGLPGSEHVEVLGAGILASGASHEALAPPPRLGEHTAEIVEWLDRG
jgi:crotonobetainyl-CoA:carnitine CoA-transferase CaiB-like acyl-CoA transferase